MTDLCECDDIVVLRDLPLSGQNRNPAAEDFFHVMKFEGDAETFGHGP